MGKKRERNNDWHKREHERIDKARERVREMDRKLERARRQHIRKRR